MWQEEPITVSRHSESYLLRRELHQITTSLYRITTHHTPHHLLDPSPKKKKKKRITAGVYVQRQRHMRRRRRLHVVDAALVVRLSSPKTAEQWRFCCFRPLLTSRPTHIVSITNPLLRPFVIAGHDYYTPLPMTQHCTATRLLAALIHNPPLPLERRVQTRYKFYV